MELSPDNVVFWRNGAVTINLTIVTTWAIMLLLTLASWVVTRNLKKRASEPDVKTVAGSRLLTFFETIVDFLRKQVREIGVAHPDAYLPFLGTLFLFIITANVLLVLPGYEPPTASLSTTAGLALCVFLAVPLFGILERGVGGYLKSFFQPNPIMAPFHVVAEITRTLALAVRLFGNVMSEVMIGGILLSVAPILFPVVMKVFGLLTGVIQAYIFFVLAAVFLSAATSGEGHD